MFKQHIPGSVDGTPKISDASTLEEVLALDWVARWAEKSNFQKWAKYEHSLIAFLSIDGVPDGIYWFVVGYADFDFDLPEAIYPKREVIEPSYSGGIQIKHDGRFWMIWKPSVSGKSMVGYCGDLGVWKYGVAQRYPSKQACEEIVNNLSEQSES